MAENTFRRWFRRIAKAFEAVFLLQALVGLAGGFAGNLVFDFIKRTTAPAVDLAREHIGTVALQFTVVLGTFVTGTLLYWFRCYSPRWYGTLEIAFGVAATVYIVNQVLGNATGNATYVFGGAAALYVIVRGYDNIYKSLDEERRKKWNKLFFRQVTDQKL